MHCGLLQSTVHWVWGKSDFPTPFSFIYKNKSPNIILKNKKIKQKNYMEKHRGNPQYFKEKNYKSEIFNQFNIQKVKSTKIILKNKWKKIEKEESWKKKKGK